MMTPAEMRANGLTFDQTETGILHDTYCFPGKPDVYLTRPALDAVLRREARHKQGQSAPDLEDMRTKIRTTRNRRQITGRKVG